MKIECERGSVSVFWVVSILLVLDILLFAGTKAYEYATISSEECSFLEKKLELEDLEEQVKLIGYALMEKSIEESLRYVEALAGRESMSAEDLEAVYMQRIEYYMSRNISVPGGAKSRDIAYIEGFVEPFEREYSYRLKSKHLSAEVTRKENSLEDVSESRYSRAYEVKYNLKDEKDEVGHLGSPVCIVLEYPLYREAASGNAAAGKVRVQKKSV